MFIYWLIFLGIVFSVLFGLIWWEYWGQWMFNRIIIKKK